MVRRLTGAGLQESGLWPKPTDLAAALRQVLEREAQVVERTDPERGLKMRRVLDEIGELGTSFAAKLAIELLRYVSGGH